MSARYPSKVLVAWRKGPRPRCPPILAIYVRRMFAHASFCERWETTREGGISPGSFARRC
eukprot:730034-Pyramimonas_sp.AAC.1